MIYIIVLKVTKFGKDQLNHFKIFSKTLRGAVQIGSKCNEMLILFIPAFERAENLRKIAVYRFSKSFLIPELQRFEEVQCHNKK